MKTVDVAKATLPLSDYAKKVKKEPVVVIKEGRPVAALPYPDLTLESLHVPVLLLRLMSLG